MYRKFFAGLLSISFIAASFSASAANTLTSDAVCADSAKNIIYIIGEGMGENLIQYTQWKYTSAYSELNMQKMSVSGLISTYSADSGTSDDASAGTQLATGSGTDNGILGMGAELDNYRKYETLIEASQRYGKRTGIVSDSQISDSVAAAFVAHSSDADKEDIENQIENATLDVKISDSSSLKADTASAISSLNINDEGFVLVIDSAKIEDYAVENNSTKAMEAVKALDDAVGVALDFAEQNGETLVIVTSEHETGSVVETELSSRSSGTNTITWLSQKPSYTNVMLFAQGKGAEHFNGYYHNTDICRKIAHITGITDWDFYDVQTIFDAPEQAPSSQVQEVELLSYDFEYPADNTVSDMTSNSNNGTLIGGAEIVYDESKKSNVLKLDNTSANGSYLEIPCGALDKMQYLTVEMDVQSNQTYDDSLSSSLFYVGASSSKYFYFKYEPLGQGLRYSLKTGTEWDVYGSKTISGISGDEWVNLKYVIEPTKHTAYINGEEFLTYETKGSLPMLGENLYSYIGHSLSSAYKDYSGFIDNIKISGIKLDESVEEDSNIKTGVEVTPAQPITDTNDLPQNSNSDKAKNVIILIGDGMGQNIVQLSQWHYNGADTPYAMQTMPYIGLSKTYSASHGVTDSAAGGTAISSGHKTINDYVGKGGAGVEYKNIMEYAHENNMATGILSTTDLTDATPAAFSAHVLTRASRSDIAAQQAVCQTDIFMGGGGDRYKSHLSNMISNGYKHITTVDEMDALDKNDKVLGLFGTSGDLVQPLDGNTTEPLLDDMVKKSINMLDGRTENGFVLMAEGATIDHYNHSNSVDGAVEQAKIFDNAIKEALDFAKKDGNTLVIVSADHETGGLGLLESSGINAGGTLNGKYKYTTGSHSSTYVPIYAYGPGAQKLTGVHENTDIFDVAMSSLGIEKDKRDTSNHKDELIFELNFDNSDLSTSHGKAVENGTLSYETGYNGKAVRFDGNVQNYIEIFDDNGKSLLANANTFTVSYWSKTEKNSSTNRIFYAAPGSETQKSGAELYTGILDKGTTLDAQSCYYGNFSAPSATFTGDEWKHVAVVFDKNKTLLYINGELQSTTDSKYSPEDILAFEPIAYIGKSNIGSSGESVQGLIDELKIHNYCLSAEQIQRLYTDGYLQEDLENGLSAEYMSDMLKYKLNINTPDNEDVYIALYNSSGVLANVQKYSSQAVIKGNFKELADDGYTIRAYIWKNNTMVPVWNSKQDVVPYVMSEFLTESEYGEIYKVISFEDSIFTSTEQVLQVK